MTRTLADAGKKRSSTFLDQLTWDTIGGKYRESMVLGHFGSMEAGKCANTQYSVDIPAVMEGGLKIYYSQQKYDKEINAETECQG